MSFSADRFPDDVSYGSSSGPGWEVTVVRMDSGREKRNLPWSQDLGEWDVSYGIKTDAQMLAVRRHFQARRGRHQGFPMKDWGDYTVTNELFGTGDGADTTFQLVKLYTSGSDTYTKTIWLPRISTVIVTKAGVTQIEGTDYTIDYLTGIVTFTVAPASSAALRWTGEFDKPARYDLKTLAMTFETFNTQSARIPIIELKAAA